MARRKSNRAGKFVCLRVIEQNLRHGINGRELSDENCALEKWGPRARGLQSRFPALSN